MISRAFAVLLVLNMALAGWLASFWVDANGQLIESRWTPPDAVAVVLPPADQFSNTGAASPGDVYAEILQKPLFAPDRKPPPPPPPVQQAKPAPPPDPFRSVVIQGLYAGEVSGAIVSVEGKSRLMALGDKVGEWVLTHIEDRTVAFKRGDETRSLVLAYARLGDPAPVAPKSTPSNAAASGAGGAAPAPLSAAASDRAARREAALQEIQRRREAARSGAGAAR